jgi:hypothetical protein
MPPRFGVARTVNIGKTRERDRRSAASRANHACREGGTGFQTGLKALKRSLVRFDWSRDVLSAGWKNRAGKALANAF